MVQLTSNGPTDGVTDLINPNVIPDRHPHFSHDGTKIIHSSKYECVMTEVRTVVSQCSIPVTVIPANPCGSNCEGLRIIDATDTDHEPRASFYTLVEAGALAKSMKEKER